MSEEDILIRISNAEMMGRVAERERIIKLLEADKKWCNADAYADLGCDCPWHLAIALIKGENK